MRNDRQQRPDYYRILGISPDATPGEVREAYRQAAKRWHPDLNPSAEAAARMREVNEAWRVLGDETIRAGYDRARRSAGQAGEGDRGRHGGDTGSREDGTREVSGGGRFNKPWISVGFVVVAALLGAASTMAISTLLEGEPEVLVVTRDVTRVVTRDVTRVVTQTPTATRTARPTPLVSPTPIWGSHQDSDYDLILREDVDNDHITCPADGVVDGSFYQGKVEFDFVVPDAVFWSVGVLYHRHQSGHDSAGILARRSSGKLRVDHWTRTEWDEISRAPFKEISASQHGVLPGRTVRLGLLTNDNGSRLYVNGNQLLFIRPEELRPVSSSLKICTGFYSGEPSDYSVEIEKYRAGWTRSAAESTAIAR